MSREERELRAWLDEVNAQFSKPVVIDNDKAAAYLQEHEQIKASIKSYEAEKEADKRRLVEISRDNYNHDIIGKNSDAAKEMLTHINKQIKASLRAEQVYYPKANKKNASYDHLEELHDIDFKQLMEAKAERTKAELLEDPKTVEELNKEIKSIEERLSFYSEQMKILAAEGTGEDGN